MWIVRLALNRPYTFVVLAILILLLSPAVILRTPTDIFPNIDIPVISVAWTYTGLNPEDMETRLTTPFEKGLTTLVDNIEHIESTTYNGTAVVKIYLQPGASVDRANSQVVALSGFILRLLPPATQPPEIINFSASSVPVLQLGVSGPGMSEQQLNDLSLNFLRTQLITVPGAVIPLPYGGKPRQVMINMDQNLMQAKNVSPSEVLNSVNAQNLILPSGTAKIAESELDVRVNVTPRTVTELGDLPIKQVGAKTIYLRDVARVSDGFGLQTNVVRQDGHRGVLVSVLKAGAASTLDVVAGIRNVVPRAALSLPPQLKITPLADQSLFVRSAISGVVREAVIAAALTGVMILLFVSSWDSGGRRHGYDRKHQPHTRRRSRGRDSAGHPGWCPTDRCTCTRFDSLHLHRLYAVVSAWRSSAISVRSASGGGGLCDARFLHSFENAGANTGGVHDQTQCGSRGVAESVR